jgi:hypothetical protein
VHIGCGRGSGGSHRPATPEALTPNSPHPIAVDEQQCADAIGLSVHFLRKDRHGKRLIPYYRVGNRILYSLDRVQAALNQLEEGGGLPKPRARKSS